MPSDQMTLALSPEMREAARFVHLLRARVVGDEELTRWAEAFGADSGDEWDRFRQVVERIRGGWEKIHRCDECGQTVWSASWYGYVGGIDAQVCHSCVEELYWCDDCDEYSRVPHEHGYSECVAGHREFALPIAGDGVLRNDTSFTVEAPAGRISDTGMAEVRRWLFDNGPWPGVWQHFDADDVEPLWQTKDGNFTKRIAKLYLQHGYKLSPVQLAEVGNIARRHTATAKGYRIELTRELNLPASDFYHDGSCWWTSESASRCALKQCGGLAIRTFDECGNVNGRAWLMPLTDSGQPTHALTAPAFVLFNAYGPDGYEFARIVAQLTGRSYRKIAFRCEPMYVNSGGFLIASESICQRTSSIELDIYLNCDCPQ